MSKALAATLSDIEPEDDSDNEDDVILNAFTATVNPIEGIVEDVDEEEEFVESKFEKIDEQDDIHIAYAKLYKVSEKQEKLYKFHAKIIIIEESKDIDKIPLTELVGNRQTYVLGLTRIGKSRKRKSMALKAKNSDIDESFNDEDFKLKSYITRQFKKFMKNFNAKGFDKDCRQSSSS